MLSREEIFDLAEPFGEFQYGDAQGDKRVAFARAVEAAAYERAAQTRTLFNFARAVEAAAYDAAIRECEVLAEHWHQLKQTGGPMRDHREGMEDAATTIADRIRSLMAQERPK